MPPNMTHGSNLLFLVWCGNGLETETAQLCLQLVNASSVSAVFGGNASADVTDVMSIDTLAVMGGVPVVCVCAPNLCDMVSCNDA